jgi:hypothetical protein
MVRYLRPLAAPSRWPCSRAAQPAGPETGRRNSSNTCGSTRKPWMAARGRLQAWNWPQNAEAGNCALRVRLLREKELTAGL